MNMMQLFEEYLPEWAEKNNQPIPSMEHSDRWMLAWKDFLKDVMAEKREEVIESYKAMNFKTVGMAKKEKQQKEKQEEVVVVQEEKPLSEWEKVKKLLDES